ncbi:MAG: hypothetical protein OZ913_02510 [Ignavibacteriaceae bacterium]|jgi:hypothetical protein|nr:MAG: hypothetical protein EDM69_05395 [Chlorobiota bacterium]KXK06078.1 MAG: hypothetical protein UZ04_CHB001000075 [Chlorobi bacterium OLB4]MBV6398510.1 hypothetical protein [Ignavibacteria bacterium]MCC6885745.1 hypothetical protein [Ignavibacteriales bacterium]MCE7953060.1 hypothetical protein [Chlorobi bacterium CHB7]MDL1887102.1 hypothetical protein [Ignavibacteria bacterium CHB1]MEB2329157.1 hypothetical protein [Ignavibacteriaceae bacterium]OQY77995.1 MAG: hypothetical protein B6D4
MIDFSGLPDIKKLKEYKALSPMYFKQIADEYKKNNPDYYKKFILPLEKGLSPEVRRKLASRILIFLIALLMIFLGIAMVILFSVS